MITLVLGGARSGKSTFAEGIARSAERMGVTYIATADSKDLEMDARIAAHRSRRPGEWRTWEGNLAGLPDAIAGMEGLLLFDCLTMYLSRLLFAEPSAEGEDEAAWDRAEKKILESVERLYKNFRESKSSCERHLVVVSNEVGFGLVPPYLMGRRFRDMQGRANQLSASYADNVALIVAGLPLWIKGGLE